MSALKFVPLGVLFACLIGCSAHGEFGLASSSQALADSGAVMGFEDPALWSSSVALASSAVHTEGSHSLSVQAVGYTPVNSVPLASLSGVTNELALDVYLPTAQPNPYWYGAVQLYATVPSKGVYNAYLGQQELTGRPLGQFSELDFTLPSAVVATLASGGYSDLTFTVVLNVPYDATGSYLLDHLRFVPETAAGCGDLVEDQIESLWTWGASDAPPATTTLSVLSGSDVLRGSQALRAATTSGFDFWLRYNSPEPIDVSGKDELRVAVRGLNETPIGWQINAPVIVVEDASGARLQFEPRTQLLSIDGVSWSAVRVPLAGGPSWLTSGGPVDWTAIRAVEIHADTWDYGFTLDVDALSFEQSDTVCECAVPCGAHGQCSQDTLSCECDLGFAGPACDTCASGFVPQNGTCVLANDGQSSVWPNAFSGANSDPWLVVHHDEIQQVRPNVLVLNFANPSTPEHTSDLVSQLFSAYAEASRVQGYKNPAQPSQLLFQLAKIVDLRDGVDGRPAPPAGYPYDNSTLFPYVGFRPDDGVGVNGRFDYAALFGEDFAHWYGYPDPSQPDSYLPLCDLVDRGLVNEVWLVASADRPDVGLAEVLEAKPRYTSTGNPIAGAVERCAGNGCFTADVPFCGRSLRIGFVNYSRGPGCFMESLGHGLESAMNHDIYPPMTRWFQPFAGFDLDTKYGLPFDSLYAVGCATEPCIEYPTPSSTRIDYFGTVYTIDPWDAVCGNVHYPPNGQSQYDLWNTTPVSTSCPGYGRHAGPGGSDLKETITSDAWRPYEQLGSDCMGAFLVYWQQNMPAYGSGQSFTDGEPMKSVWPFLYY